MAIANVVTLDLNFQGAPRAIASYLVPHSDGVVLVECGPGSTVKALQAALAAHGYAPRDVTHVLLTHIHLDHAGAAGWMARNGATICVHHVGAPHLVNPEKLLRSAQRIYGEAMDSLWGEFLPVPESSLLVPADGEELQIGGLRFTTVDTPGHAEHHFAYVLDDLCFSGDVGGIRMPGYGYVRVPMPPPELNLVKWMSSVRRLRALDFARIAPTHFGIFDDPAIHLDALDQALEGTIRWLEANMRDDPDVDELRRRFVDWSNAEGTRQGLAPDAARAFELANPLGMSADGLFRYWHKVLHSTTA